MSVISNSAVQSVCLAMQTNSTYPVQRTNDCYAPMCSVNRSILLVEVSSVWLINSKQTFTLLLVYYSTLIIHLCSYFFVKINTYFQKCFSFWGTLSPDPLPGLCPWTPLGDFRPQTPWPWTPQSKISGVCVKCKRNRSIRSWDVSNPILTVISWPGRSRLALSHTTRWGRL